MSRLDDHVNTVQNKLALRQFVQSLIVGSVAVAGAVLVGTLVDRLFGVHPPRPALWVYGAIVALVAFAMAVAIRRRPDAKAAAIAIDQSLGLKEKFSTALYLRRSDDLFARAAVKDAEASAANVTLHLGKHFPLRWPRQMYWTLVLLVASGVAVWLIKPLDLFGHKAAEKQRITMEASAEAARQNVSKALAAVEAVPKVAAADENLKLARSDLQALLQRPITDPASANRTASKALQDAQQAINEQIKNSSKFAQAQNQSKMMRSLQTPANEQGPVADAQRDLAKGDFQSALNQLDNAVANFEKMDLPQQAAAARQASQLAQQLSQMAKDPAQQQKMQDQLHQMGLNPQQAQQAQQLLNQAAQGDKQAQQQLQQMAQQEMAKLNNGQGATPQQQQKMQQLMQQVQAQANAQQQAQQMSQAAQQMAQAMQQAQQASQPGQPRQPQAGNQPMQQAMNQMQQQLQQMQAQHQDAQQIAAAQQAAQQAGQQQGQQPGQQGSSPGNQPGQNPSNADGQANSAGQGQSPSNQPGGAQQPGQGNQPGQWGNGGPSDGGPAGNAANNGMAGGGQGAGDRTFKTQAPYTVTPEVSPSQDDDAGRILASTFIKDNKPLKGGSSASLQDIAQAAEQDKTDEIDSERISRAAQSAVKNYFNSMQGDR